MIPPEQRSLYLREILRGVATVLEPELSSAGASDAAGHIQRILAHLIVAEEEGAELERAWAAGVRGPLEALSAGSTVPAGYPEAIEAAAGAARGAADADRGALLELLTAERAYIAGIFAGRDRLLSAPEQEGAAGHESPSISPEQLTSYLRSRLPESPDVRVVRMTLVPGGRSKETVLVELADPGSLPSELVLRKDVQIGLNATTSSDEFALLQVAERVGVPAPRPVLAEADASTLGGSFILVSLVTGERKGEIFPDVLFPTEGRREIGLQIARAVARIHSVDRGVLEGTHLALDSDLTSELEARIDALEERFHGVTDGEPSVLFDVACRWLRTNLDAGVAGPRVFNHGDLGLHNMLIDGTTLTALLDWELARFGPASADLGQLRHSVRALMPWEEFVEAYLEAGGRPEACVERNILFHAIIGKCTGLANTQLGGQMFRTGSKRSLVTANSAADFRYRLIGLLADEMAAALALPDGASPRVGGSHN